MQRLIIKLNNKMSIQIEGNDTRDLIKKGVLWSEIPDKCPKCESDLALMYRNPQTFEYFGLRCLGTPVHVVNFGEYKDSDKGFYYDPSKWSQDLRGLGDRDHQRRPEDEDQSKLTDNRPITKPNPAYTDDIPF